MIGQGLADPAEALESAVGVDLCMRADARAAGGDDRSDRKGGLIVHDVAVQGPIGGVRTEGLPHPVRIEMGMDVAEDGQEQPASAVDDLARSGIGPGRGCDGGETPPVIFE